MLDMGFIPDIEEICSKLPKNRQTLLFSATMPPPIQKLAAKFLSDPKRVEVARPATANVNIEQRLVPVKADRKKDALKELLRSDEFKNAIVFCNRKTTVRELASSLRRAGFAAGQIQGDMDQAQRIAEFERFKSGDINILIASDVAARGLDVKGVSHVFNFDVPWQPDDYIHRIGRTGRAGRTGIAITLATSADAEAIEAIEKLIGTQIRPVEGLATTPDEPEAEAEPEAGEAAPRRARRERAPRRGSRKEQPAAQEAPDMPPEAEEAPRAEASPKRPRREAAPRRAERKAETRVEPKADARPEPKADARPEPRPARDPELPGLRVWRLSRQSAQRRSRRRKRFSAGNCQFEARLGRAGWLDCCLGNAGPLV
jgi:superfamily II DNA/RNA helicase